MIGITHHGPLGESGAEENEGKTRLSQERTGNCARTWFLSCPINETDNVFICSYREPDVTGHVWSGHRGGVLSLAWLYEYAFVSHVSLLGGSSTVSPIHIQ